MGNEIKGSDRLAARRPGNNGRNGGNNGRPKQHNGDRRSADTHGVSREHGKPMRPGGNGSLAGLHGSPQDNKKQIRQSGNKGSLAGTNGISRDSGKTLTRKADGTPAAAPRVSRSTSDKHQAGGRSAAPAAPTVTAGEADSLRAGDIVAVTIKRLGINGEGVGYYRRKAIFVNGALPGEVVKAKITGTGPNLLYAATIEVEQASPDRTQAFCPVFEECGGCQLQHMSYAGQLREKEEIVREAFYRYAGISSEKLPLSPIIGMDNPQAYRNKAQLQLGRSGEAVLAGLYSPGSRRLIDITGCPVQHGKVNDVLRAVKEIIASLNLPIADPSKFRSAAPAEAEFGEYAVRAPASGAAARPLSKPGGAAGHSSLRTVVARAAFDTGAVQLTFVTTGTQLPSERVIVREIRSRLPEVVSIAHNINPADTPLIFGEKTRVVWGAERIQERLGSLTFELSPRAFFQLNPVQTVRLYDAAKSAAALTGAETVADAYCGVGTISLWLAAAAKEIRGIEAAPEAVEDARRNARLNSIGNAAFHAGLAEELLPQWAAAGFKPDVVVVDPPRSGCDRRLLDALTRNKPGRIVYVSCNPATLAKDTKVLLDGGYRLVSIQPVDMFPHTAHAECVSLIVLKEEAGSR